MREIKAYRMQDGKVLESESEALLYQLAEIVCSGMTELGREHLAGYIKDVVVNLVERDSEVASLLVRYRRTNPRMMQAKSDAET